MTQISNCELHMSRITQEIAKYSKQRKMWLTCSKKQKHNQEIGNHHFHFTLFKEKYYFNIQTQNGEK